MFNYSDMLNNMKNPVSLESMRKSVREGESAPSQIGQILVNGVQVSECQGQGRLNVLRYNMPGKEVR